MEIEPRRRPFAPTTEQTAQSRRLRQRAERLLYEADKEFSCYSKTLGKLKQKEEEAPPGSEARDLAELEVKSMRVAIIDHIDKINRQLECLEWSVLENNYEVVNSVRAPSKEVFEGLGLENCTDYQSLREMFY